MALADANLKNDLIDRLVTPKLAKLSDEQRQEMEWLCEQLAQAITDQIRTGEVTVSGNPETVNVT